MAPTIKRKCSKCETMHMGHKDICWKCANEEIRSANVRHCALCGAQITRQGRGDASSPYCSLKCSNAVAKARAKAISLVAKAVRTGRIAKASDCTCVDCGMPAFDYDHREYLKPLNVVPVCRSCNIKRGPAIDIKELVSKHRGGVVAA